MRRVRLPACAAPVGTRRQLRDGVVMPGLGGDEGESDAHDCSTSAASLTTSAPCTSPQRLPPVSASAERFLPRHPWRPSKPSRLELGPPWQRASAWPLHDDWRVPRTSPRLPSVGCIEPVEPVGAPRAVSACLCRIFQLSELVAAAHLIRARCCGLLEPACLIPPTHRNLHSVRIASHPDDTCPSTPHSATDLATGSSAGSAVVR